MTDAWYDPSPARDEPRDGSADADSDVEIATMEGGR